MAKTYQVKVSGQIYEVEVEFLSESGSSITHTPTPSTPVSTPATTVVVGKGEGVIAPMQGNIWKILKKVGDTIKAGETILILEAMKMENNIVSPKDGTIVSLLVKEGDTVESGATLVEIS
ncbi:MAG: biotin/lipoyl-containing protein [Brevinema sp.]